MNIKLVILFIAAFIPPSLVIAQISGNTDKEIRKIFQEFEKYDIESRVLDKREFKVFTVLTEGKVAGWAVVLDVMGKTHPITFLVGIDNQGRVLDVAVLEYREAIGSGIKRKSFLRQFRGKTAKDRLLAGRDIDAVTGATISSDAAAVAVKKSLELIEQFYRR